MAALRQQHHFPRSGRDACRKPPDRAPGRRRRGGPSPVGGRVTVAWLDTIGALAGAHVAAVRERWAARGHPTTGHDVVDEIVNTEYPLECPEPLTPAASAAPTPLAPDARCQRWTAALRPTHLNPPPLSLPV